MIQVVHNRKIAANLSLLQITLWWKLRRRQRSGRLLEKRGVILPVDGELLKQLSGRRLQYDSKARIQLEPKESMRARGLSSPDRADAVIGAAVMSLPGFAGGITLDTLAGMQFGRPQGHWVLFDSEPVTFD